MQDKIKVLLVDDHGIVRNGLKLLLELDGRIEVCGEAETLSEAMQFVAENNPDVVLMDFKLPDGDGIIGCFNLKIQRKNIKVIILTAYADDHIVTEAIKAGADGYLLKNVESEKLISTIVNVYLGRPVLDPAVMESVFDAIKIPNQVHNVHLNLSPKEIHILEKISLGKANKEIAAELKISDKTVRNYVSNIFRKLNVSNRTEAAMYWFRNKSLASGQGQM